MSDEKIAEIKERHEFISSRTAAFFFPETAWTAHDDRATLLAEVERLRARVRQLEQVREAALNACADWYLSLHIDERDSYEYVEPNIGLMGSMSKLCETAWDAAPATQNAAVARGKP